MSVTAQEADKVWAAKDIFAVTEAMNEIVTKHLAQAAAEWQAKVQRGLPGLMREAKHAGFVEAQLVMDDYYVDPIARTRPISPYQVPSYEFDVDSIEKEINQ